MAGGVSHQDQLWSPPPGKCNVTDGCTVTLTPIRPPVDGHHQIQEAKSNLARKRGITQYRIFLGGGEAKPFYCPKSKSPALGATVGPNGSTNRRSAAYRLYKDSENTSEGTGYQRAQQGLCWQMGARVWVGQGLNCTLCPRADFGTSV